MNKTLSAMLAGEIPSEQELAALIEQEDFSEVFAVADQVRANTVGDIVHIRALLEFSNYCGRRCSYCGLNCQNKQQERFRMQDEEIVQCAKGAHQAGYRTVVLQSGEDPTFTAKRLGAIVQAIKKDTDLVVTLSCGEMSKADYQHLKQCGASRYLLKHETADATIYQALHADSSLDRRVNCLRDLKALGYETGSGFMVGLPNQTTQTLARDLLLLRALNCDMAGIGPFIPHPQTPLHAQPPGSVDTTRRMVALARVLLPNANIPATTALGVLSKEGKDSVFSCGANVIMRKVTPQKYAALYEIYPANIQINDLRRDRLQLEQQIIDLGKCPR